MCKLPPDKISTCPLGFEIELAPSLRIYAMALILHLNISCIIRLQNALSLESIENNLINEVR
jgi:hypothetical protein